MVKIPEASGKKLLENKRRIDDMFLHTLPFYKTGVNLCH